jgi:CTP:molybdopterin cytidylyltransferase MocA
MQFARSFMLGYAKASGLNLSRMLPLPTERSVSAVIHAATGHPSISAVLEQLGRLALDEIIVVAGGLPDDRRRLIREHPSGPVLVHYPEPLGYGAGRAAGARFAASDIVLFLEEQEPVRAEELLPYIASVAKGNDLAIGMMPGQHGPFGSREPAAMLKEFMNLIQGRRDLGTASLEHCPHALSRRAIDRLGAANLAVPPVAQAAALLQGLRAAALPASSSLPGRAVRRQEDSPAGLMPEVLMGDRLEAFHEQIRTTGPRSRFPDHLRKREAAKEAST